MKRVIPLLLVLGCGARPQATETLAESIRGYNDGVRWQRFEVAATRVPARERSKFVEEMDERAEDLRITEYDVVKVDRTSERVAKVQIKVSWYKDTEGTLRHTHAVQTWERHGKVWLMVDESRMRGAEMPGLAEPIADATPAVETAPAADRVDP